MNTCKRQVHQFRRMMRRVKCDRGAALIEFAIVVPVLTLLSIGAVDYGGAVNVATKLNSAARAGAQYGINHPADACGVYKAVQNATTNATSSITIKMVKTTVASGATSAAFTTVPTTSGTCSATSTTSSYWWYCTCSNKDSSLTNAVDCNNSTGTCGASNTYFYIAAQVSENYQPTFNVSRLAFVGSTGLSPNIQMTGSATLQFQ